MTGRHRAQRSRIPRLRATRLTINASALMASSAGTGLLGLVYWIVAEHMFPTAEVGRASAVISSATALSSLACLSLGGAFQRFLPLAGAKSLRYILGGYLITGGAATVLGTGFVVLGFGDRILRSTAENVGFVAIVVVFAIYALADPILTGLRRAPAVAAKNISLSVLKIIPIVALAGAPAAFAIAGSWAALAAIITAFFVFHTFRVALGRRADPSEDLPAGRELLTFQGAFFAMMLVSSVMPLALPLVVVAQAGTTTNAYFNLAWTMCSASGLLRSSVGAAFVVEASSPGADRGALLRHLGKMLTLVTGVVALGLAIGGPLILWVAGPAYLHAAGPLMVVMAVNSVIETCALVYFLIAQLRRRLTLMVVAQMLIVTVTVGGSYLLIGPLGLVGVAVASLAASTLALCVVGRPLIDGIREIVRQPPTQRSDDESDEHSGGDATPRTVPAGAPSTGVALDEHVVSPR